MGKGRYDISTLDKNKHDYDIGVDGSIFWIKIKGIKPAELFISGFIIQIAGFAVILIMAFVIIILLTVFLEKNKSDYQNAISVAKNRLKQLQE